MRFHPYFISLYSWLLHTNARWHSSSPLNVPLQNGKPMSLQNGHFPTLFINHKKVVQMDLLLMEYCSTVDGIHPAPVGYVRYGKHPSVQKGFMHTSWCRISFTGSIMFYLEGCHVGGCLARSFLNYSHSNRWKLSH